MPRYDGAKPATTADGPIVHGLLADVPLGDAVDAACGTGRHAAKLATYPAATRQAFLGLLYLLVWHLDVPG